MKIKPLESREKIIISSRIKPKTLIFIFVFFILISFSSGFLLKTHLQNFEPEDLLEKLKTHILVPDEIPQIGEINDIEKLKKELPNVYKDANKGDILFIFSDRMIIYRVSEEKIINYVYLIK